MSAIYLLIAASFIVALGFLLAFFWAIRSGQYDDDYTPSVRVLFEKKEIEKKETNNQKTDQ
jgi:cbb3-type cytochrome oxidase maturation protein